MRELFFSLAALALLRHLQLSDWWNIPFLMIVLAFDYILKRREIKAQGEIEAFKLFIKNGGAKR